MTVRFVTTARFPLGECRITPAALETIPHEEVLLALPRHQAGDWGEVDIHDRKENEHSLKEGFRLFSIYRARNGTRFYVITEADRSSTTVLLPEDY